MGLQKHYFKAMVFNFLKRIIFLQIELHIELHHIKQQKSSPSGLDKWVPLLILHSHPWGLWEVQPQSTSIEPEVPWEHTSKTKWNL